MQIRERKEQFRIHMENLPSAEFGGGRGDGRQTLTAAGPKHWMAG